jgi:hypothetical protein
VFPDGSPPPANIQPSGVGSTGENCNVSDVTVIGVCDDPEFQSNIRLHRTPAQGGSPGTVTNCTAHRIRINGVLQ